MDKVSKKSFKSDKKVKSNTIAEKLDINFEEISDVDVIKVKKTDKKLKSKKTSSVEESVAVEQIEEMVEEKVKKSKKRKASEVDEIELQADESNVTTEIEIKKIKKSKKNEVSEENKMVVDDECNVNESIKPLNTPMFNAIIVNLPSEVSKEELINFLSNRSIPIDGLQLNDNKYAIIETESTDTINQISALLATKPMTNNTQMKVSQLFGNPLKLSNFSAKKPLTNKRVVVVKNVDCETKIDDVLSTIENQDDIVKHSSVFVLNRGIKTQMLTIEFKSAEHTDDIIRQFNEVALNGKQLTAEHKYNLVDADPNEVGTRTDALIVKNLPLSATKESIMQLTKNFDVLPKSIQLLSKLGKNCCYIKFNSAKKASAAFEVLKEEIVEGLKLEVKFVPEVKESSDGELAKTKLKISNMPFTVKKEDMEREFSTAESVKLPITLGGRSKGLCYVSFKTEEMAALAMDGIQDRIICGRKIKCEYVPMSVAFEETDNSADKKRKVQLKTKEKPIGAVVTLYNLPAGVTPKDIIANFANVKLVNIVKKGESFKGIAEVHFKDAAAAHVAMSAAEFSLRGRVIRKELKGGNWRIGTMTKKVPKVRVTKAEKTLVSDESDSGENSEAESMES